MKRILIAILLASLMTGLTVSQTKALQFDKSEYAGRRSKLMEKFPDGLIILQGAASLPNYYAFMQNNNFLYLTGVEIENAYLMIDPINKESILFADRAGESGFDKVMRPRELKDYLAKRFEEVKIFYTCFQPEELARECSGEKSGSLNFTMVKNEWDTRPMREMQFVENLKSKYPGVTVKDCSAYIHEMRTIKSPAEIDLIRKAAKIAVQAHIDVIKATRPGVKEQELAALFEYACKKEGAGNAVHEACMQTYRPGLTAQQCKMEVREILIKKGFNPDSDLLKQFGGGFGHYVGMAVHDVGGGPSLLKPGMVFANEPLAVFAKEKLGVRIEDTVVITETGCENLTAGLPRTIAEIEALMKQ